MSVIVISTSSVTVLVASEIEKVSVYEVIDS